MDIKMSPRKSGKPVDVVHNGTNTSPEEAKRILNTTSAEANADYLFGYLIDNFASVKAELDNQMKELHEGKVVVPIKENADELKKIVDFLKSKGRDVNIKPDLSFETLNVSVTAIYKDELSFNSKETEVLMRIMNTTTNFYMEALPKDVGIRLYFVFNDVGEYVDPSEVNE